MSTPVIGLSCYREDATWGVWTTPADLLPRTYTGSVERAGGLPVMLPAAAPALASAIVARLDGLIITGGPDVDPARYDTAPHPRTQASRPDRDAWELALLDAAAAIGLPTLGICRGAQVMAVHGGGTLHQHVPELIGHEQHSGDGSTFTETTATVDPASRVAALIGPRIDDWCAAVSCHHHQAIDSHPGFTVSARSADGTVEAIEQEGDRFYLGVQWHPEERQDAGLFVGLVTAAAEYAGRSQPAAR
ncbi:gamma-glutamyl-gamma-aminobutyrate hydrolase [Microlunatus endophyticus]|uniref:Gamma-glutamyl-gamma-aminobutyrate hydrolase n=1 Tax=Microlunatus endophyticus TaxID=1716077 RepID=A0A917SHA0_9ACTN|nr:gamma-glutamyl-gamma-aminobutyrate hydrolase family protein [Microlunatus endophyticus]GGL78699.1 gamma-glutamyl-gamma-aminobutyrate hydrolase [Microlunatus endophyticus]